MWRCRAHTCPAGPSCRCPSPSSGQDCGHKRQQARRGSLGPSSPHPLTCLHTHTQVSVVTTPTDLPAHPHASVYRHHTHRFACTPTRKCLSSPHPWTCRHTHTQVSVVTTPTDLPAHPHASVCRHHTHRFACTPTRKCLLSPHPRTCLHTHTQVSDVTTPTDLPAHPHASVCRHHTH